VLLEVPDLLKNAKANLAVGLAAAFRMLLRVQEECEQDVARSSKVPPKVIVHVGELATWAREAGAAHRVHFQEESSICGQSEFEQAAVTLKMESLPDSKSYTVIVSRPASDRSGHPQTEAGPTWELRHSLCLTWSYWKITVSVLIAFLSLLCLAVVFGVEFRWQFVRPLPHLLGVSPRLVALASGSLSAIGILVIGSSCWCHRYHGYVPAPVSYQSVTAVPASIVVSRQEVGPREPFLARRGYCQLEAIDEGESVELEPLADQNTLEVV